MAGALIANALLFPAITLYLGNSDRFGIPFFPALELVIIISVLLLLSAFVVLGRLDTRRQKSAGIAFAIFSLLFWVQGNFLVWDYGSLDGRGINWRDFQDKSIIDIAIWLALAVVLVKLSQKRDRLVVEVAAVIFALQLAAAAYNLVAASPKLFHDDRAHEPPDMSQLTGFHAHDNVLHIVTDGFQADVFEAVIGVPELEDIYNQALDGFVYYRESLGIFPYTRFSVPGFLSGRVYANDQAKDDFIDEVLQGRTIISTARDEGFDTDLIVAGSYWLKRYARLPHTHVHRIGNTPGINSAFADSALLFDLALFRVTPGALKILVYNNQKWLASQVFSPGEEFQFTYFRHTYLLEMLTGQMHKTREKPVYKYLHVLNTHNPMVVGEDCMFKGQPSPAFSRYSLTIQSKCTMDTLARLFDRMKVLGIYDGTTIIIHGDHGGWIGTRRQGPDIILEDGSVAPPWVKSLASPLIAIKVPGARGPIRTSGVPASLLDLPDTIADIMGWPGNFGHASLVRLAEDVERTRYFRFYGWQENAWRARHAPPILEFSIRDSHYEGAWTHNRLILPPAGE